MEEKLKSLMEILKKEANLYEKLLGLCREEKGVIIKGDLKTLERITKGQEDLFLELRAWEKARQLLIKDLRKVLSLSEEVTFSQLIKKLREPFASQCKQLQKRIVSLMKDIEQVNKTNTSLITYSIKFIDDCFALLTETKEIPLYTSNGKSGKKEQRKKLLDQKT